MSENKQKPGLKKVDLEDIFDMLELIKDNRKKEKEKNDFSE